MLVTKDKDKEEEAPKLLFLLCAHRFPLREKKTKKKETVGTNWNWTTTWRREKKTNEQHYAFVGTEKLYGHANVSKLENAHVVIIGIGGIGSWCAGSFSANIDWRVYFD